MKKQLGAIVMTLLVTFGAHAQWTGQSSSSDLTSTISRTGMVGLDGYNTAQIRLNSAGTYYGKIGNPSPQIWSLGWGTSVLDINPALTWTATGLVGIGTTTPYTWSRLHVKAPGANPWGIIAEASTGDKVIGISHDGTNGVIATGYLVSAGYTPLQFQTSSLARMTITTNGNIGIGTANPDQLLAVKGIIHSQEVRVDLNVAGPDYVFEHNYHLPTLEEIKIYIDQNKHLPEVPAAAEMEKNGVQLGEMNMLLLKKVEELTLYMIQIKKENYELKARLDKIEPEKRP